MDCFTADFLLLFTEKRQNLAFGWVAFKNVLFKIVDHVTEKKY